MTLNLRTTLLIGYAFIVILMGSFAIFTGLSFISDTVVNEAKLSVQNDLNAAWIAYNEEKALLQSFVSIISQREFVRSGFNNNNLTLQDEKLLDQLMNEYKLDFLLLISKDGKIINSSDNKLTKKFMTLTVIKEALLGSVSSGTSLLSQKELSLLGKNNAERAYIPLIPTERARPTDKSVEDRGMVIEAAVPILGVQQNVEGVVYGGILLNQRYDLVDDIRKAVFDIDYYNGKPLGTVTIFLWDTRIATNVIKKDSSRAIGTRVSDEVYTKVLEKGERFGDRAFVVNDWYLSAYDPIKNIKNEIIGILYVGLLEKKYIDYKSELTYKYLGMVLLALIVSAIIAYYFAGNIRKQISKLIDATSQIANGQLNARVVDNEGSSDIRKLGKSFNSMATSLQLRSEQLEKASQEIKEAYQEADEKNRAYREMLGFVTHELKSPLASIVFAIASLRDKTLGEINEGQESLLKSSAKSADYLNRTIANFLNLSRIEEGALKLKIEEFNPCETLCKLAVQRLSELIADNKMKVDCKIPVDIKIRADATLLSSVFQNLISNAVKYGKKGSKIITQCIEEKNQFVISVYNEGIGFSEKQAESLFTKFSRFSSENYSTKSGTGLGLFVAKMIIEKHGGKIWAESEKGKWAKFIFTIPKNINEN